ncbi:MAG: hypothetical protein HQK79_17770 [Desulfobacterales bacterium]|nr:hypothetical protein [Desulfobacterales bacterium]MBF0396435.1 hypothetical protein [Desulfobacterales bacterium]
MPTYRRSLIFNINKFQVYILFPTIITALVILSFLGLLYYLSVNEAAVVYETANSTVVYNQFFGNVKNFIPVIVAIISIMVLILVFWSYRTSNKLVGPYERILKELDEIIEGKRDKISPTREGDEMFEELLKRINLLVEKHKSHGL